MSAATFQIFTIDDLQDKARLNDRAKYISIFSDHLINSNARAVKVAQIRRQADGSWPQHEFDFLSKYKGNYTAQFEPGKELMFLTLEGNNGRAAAPNYGMFYPGMQGTEGAQYFNQDTMALVERILELEKKVLSLQQENKDLKDGLQQFETGADRLAYAAGLFAEKIIFPRLGIFDTPLTNQNNNSNMQGANEWQNLDVSGDTDGHIENALILITEAFGEDFVLKFARKVKANPGLVDQLKLMI